MSADDKPQFKVILTFIIQEEGKEAKEHERLEVVQGIYWVLKAWRKVKHIQNTNLDIPNSDNRGYIINLLSAAC